MTFAGCLRRRPDRVRHWECRGDGFLRRAEVGVSPTTRAFRMAGGIDDDVVNDVVITGRADPGGHVVEIQRMANLPGDNVVGGGSVAADPDRSEQRAVRGIKREAATEDVHATALLAGQRIVWFAVVFRRAFVGGSGIHRVAVLQAEERTARLGGAVKVCGRERQTRQAEGVRRVRLLGGYHPAAWPLFTSVRAGEANRAHFAVAIDDGRPHVEAETRIAAAGDNRFERGGQLGVRGQVLGIELWLTGGRRTGDKSRNGKYGGRSEEVQSVFHGVLSLFRWLFSKRPKTQPGDLEGGQSLTRECQVVGPEGKPKSPSANRRRNSVTQMTVASRAEALPLAQKAEALRVQAADDRLEGRIAELLLQLPDEEQE